MRGLYFQCAIVHVNADEPLCFCRHRIWGCVYNNLLKNENIIVYIKNTFIHGKTSL